MKTVYRRPSTFVGCFEYIEKEGGELTNEATEQQKRFIDEYIKLRESNQTLAAINAGYSSKSASSQSSQLLKNPKVLAYLKERKKELEQQLRQEFLYDALEARKVMYEIMNDYEAPDNVRLSAAKDFLDRAGYKPIEKTEIDATVKHDKLGSILEQLSEPDD